MEPLLHYQTFQQQMREYYANQGKPLPDIYTYSDEYDYQKVSKKKKKKDITIEEFQRDSISSTDSENPIFKKEENEGSQEVSLLPRDSL